jgi:L-alanine-DL-glutamate epimerase-like enolase superfamily enzyme
VLVVRAEQLAATPCLRNSPSIGPLAHRAMLARTIGVVRFEEPVSSDDREGLRFIRDRSPASIEIAAGEYGYDPFYFRRMLEAGAVDVLQADATRCGGYTGFLKVAETCAGLGTAAVRRRRELRYL